MTELKNPMISVRRGEESSYGGNQRWSENPVLRRAGCGVIAAADLLYYLALYHGCPTPFTGMPDSNIIDFPVYERLCLRLMKSYLPVIPNFGKTGPAMALGLNALFAQYRLPYRATWRVSHKSLWESIEEMLRNELPVTISVGANFPAVWGRERVRLYEKCIAGYRPAARTKAHYMTVTGLDGQWLRVSSWGREYYLRRSEYTDYVHRHGSPITSNILYIKKLHS